MNKITRNQLFGWNFVGLHGQTDDCKIHFARGKQFKSAKRLDFHFIKIEATILNELNTIS